LLLTASGLLHAETAPFEYNIFIYRGRLSADFRFGKLFTEELVESIKAGLPLHLELTVKLKKSYSLWFDPTLEEYDCSANIEYKPFGARFAITITDFEGDLIRESFKYIDDLQARLNEELLLVCGPTTDYNPEDNFYFDFKMELRRLTAGEISSAGKWYSGGEKSEPDSSEKGPGLQQKIFEQIVDIAGRGPVQHHFSGYIFKLVDLKQVIP